MLDTQHKLVNAGHALDFNAAEKIIHSVTIADGQFSQKC